MKLNNYYLFNFKYLNIIINYEIKIKFKNKLGNYKNEQKQK